MKRRSNGPTPEPMDLGTARIRPAGRMAAGSWTTLRWTYTTGHPIDDTGSIKIAFRYAGDFGVPQMADPKAPNYCSIGTSGDCRIEARWDPKGHTRPWDRTLFLKVMGGYLDRGDTVTVLFGDRSGGSPGWRVQTFCEDSFEFKTLVDPIASYQFRELPVSPTLKIVPGQPVRAVCIAPSLVEKGRAFHFHLKSEDAWGNPVRRPGRHRHPGFAGSGFRTVTGKDPKTGLKATSNPVEVVESLPTLRPFWADLHGQSEETIGTNTIADYFRFARDYARVDIAAHQGNDFQITDAFWKEINRVTRRFYEPGSFVTFPGYEWSGNTPLGGDRNVWFTSEGGPIIRSSLELLPGARSEWSTAATAADLFAALRDQVRPEPLYGAHVGGRYADLATHDPGREFAVEVHSAWGTFEWMIDEALQRGYRIGIVANSDGHKGRPGASYPGAGKFGSLGGLTCYLARRLDRRGILESMQARRFYATTGNRPLIAFSATNGVSGYSVPMGGVLEVEGGEVSLSGRVVGTGPVQEVQIRGKNGVLRSFRNFKPADLGSRIRITWRGAKVRGRDRMVRWDGSLKVTRNRILDIQPINFWNSSAQPKVERDREVAWESVTTGGVAGVILRLSSATAGSIQIVTPQGVATVNLRAIGEEGRIWKYGGLNCELRIERLPDVSPPAKMDVELQLAELPKGDHPFYLHLVQEDGHMAWTSPITVVS
ncbi:MAG: DUF3604 domain-containing protein [Opitutaceae bacterium]